jgi:hypothetical protein
MQRGEIRPWPPKNPTYWQLRYWTTELVNGRPVKKRKAVKLAEISRQYSTVKSVEPLAQEKLLPHNLGTHRPESTDRSSRIVEGLSCRRSATCSNVRIGSGEETGRISATGFLIMRHVQDFGRSTP